MVVKGWDLLLFWTVFVLFFYIFETAGSARGGRGCRAGAGFGLLLLGGWFFCLLILLFGFFLSRFFVLLLYDIK